VVAEDLLPFPTLVLLALAIGVAAALSAGNRLRLSLKPVLLTGSFITFFIFIGLVWIPVSAYFYIFYGDWFVLYSIDVRRIPSAVALVGFLLEGGIGVLGFLLGASLARTQRSSVGAAVIALCLAASGAVVFFYRERLSVIGSYAQYYGDFGLEPYRSSALMKSVLPMSVILFAGTVFLLIRLYFWRGRRS
jgi:hypothetical protein